MSLWLNPPNGARSSTAVSLWLLKKVTPVRSRAANLVGRPSSADHTVEHSPDHVSFARATA
jgi:hypothetical protein